MSLAEFWFVLIAFLFAGYFFLEGFDFGVGMLLPCSAQDDVGPPRPDQYDRAGLGPERDVADRGGGAHCSPRSPSGTPRCSAASICRCC